MDNILYIGPYREFSGMGNAARAYIKALIHSGANISVRPIYNIFRECPEEEIDQEILELESNFSKKYHKIIQHCFPHQFCFNKKFDQHIGIIHLESLNYKNNVFQYMDGMDDVIVGSSSVYNEINGKISSNIHIVPEPIDLEKIKEYQNITTKTEKDTFNFYCIADFIDRKNIDKILLCFTKILQQHQNIELIIKTRSYLGEELIIKDKIEYEFSKIYGLSKTDKIKKKPKIVIGDIKTEGIYYIHNNNDCFINISSGESFGHSTLEAMAFENNIIVNKKIGSYDIVKDGCGLYVDSVLSNCFDIDRLFPMYNTVDQFWYEPTINSISEQMINAINETKKQREQRQINQKEKIKEFSIEKVSSIISNI